MSSRLSTATDTVFDCRQKRSAARRTLELERYRRRRRVLRVPTHIEHLKSAGRDASTLRGVCGSGAAGVQRAHAHAAVSALLAISGAVRLADVHRRHRLRLRPRAPIRRVHQQLRLEGHAGDEHAVLAHERDTQRISLLASANCLSKRAAREAVATLAASAMAGAAGEAAATAAAHMAATAATAAVAAIAAAITAHDSPLSACDNVQE
eukprot:3284635-Pleurochrysis_carterae.AAC.1